MNETETASVLTTLRVAYPGFYNKITSEEAKVTIKLWADLFANDDYDVVMIALKALITNHSGYPPDIATLRHHIDEMILAASGEPTDEDLWHSLQEAAANGTYHFRSEFDKLPPILKRYVGTPKTLYELAQTEETTFNTVNKSLFLKEIRSIRERIRFENQTPPQVRETLAAAHIAPSQLTQPKEKVTHRINT